MIDKLIKVCEKHILPDSALAVVRELYIPFLPKYWNGVLILAESQDLSKKNASYVEWLNGLSAGERIKRLYLRDALGIQPWDDGTLKLAVEAALKIKASEVAVSNAVLWSQRVANDKNDNLDEKLQDLSSEIWKELLPILNPTLLVCCGKIAKGVIDSTGWTGKILNLRLPSQKAMSHVVGMFDEKNMFSQYPEVNAVALEHPDWVGNICRLNKLSFSCHAVSLTRSNQVKVSGFEKKELVRCPRCTCLVRMDHLEKHIRKIHELYTNSSTKEIQLVEKFDVRKKSLVRCPRCTCLVRKDRLENHIRKIHELYTNSSTKEGQWVKKKCERCAEIIYTNLLGKTPKNLCQNCILKSRALKKVNKNMDGEKETRLNYAKVSYSRHNLSGWPMQGGSPGLGKRS